MRVVEEANSLKSLLALLDKNHYSVTARVSEILTGLMFRPGTMHNLSGIRGDGYLADLQFPDLCIAASRVGRSMTDIQAGFMLATKHSADQFAASHVFLCHESIPAYRTWGPQSILTLSHRMGTGEGIIDTYPVEIVTPHSFPEALFLFDVAS